MASVISKAIIENSITVSAVESKALVNKAIKVQNLSPVAASALGRTITVVALMGRELKNPSDYLTATVKGGGPLGTITACADGKGHVKGTVANPSLESTFKADGSLDVASAVGRDGELTVIKDIGLKQPYVGTCKLVSGEIARDFAQYFYTSEQQPCAVTLGVAFDKNGKCKSAGGVLVEVLPNCPNDLLDRVETILYAMDEMSWQFNGSTAREVIERFFGEFNLVFAPDASVSYKCDCSTRKINRLIKGLGKDECNDIIAEQGQIEVICHFCGKKYVYDKTQVDVIFSK